MNRIKEKTKNMKYGLLGYPLAHTMSPFIHKKLFDAENINANYELYECEKLYMECMASLKKLDGFNVTIPHKENIIEYLQSLDEGAKTYMSTNTIDNKQSLIGYNTDVDGFLKSIERLGSDLSGKVLILGAGGVARMAIVETAKRGGQIEVAVRKKSFVKAERLIMQVKETYAQASICIIDINNIIGEYDILINCTPVGMYPNIDSCPVVEEVIKRSKAIFDMIYNPTDTMLLQTAQKNDIPNIGGMYMLVTQAMAAHKIWNGTNISNDIIDNITKDANIFMKFNFQKCSVAFVGFMASGKTTLTKAFAKVMKMQFVDMDEEITKIENLPIPEIFSQKGESYFRESEIALLNEYTNKKNIAISTGGGVPMYDRNKELLQKKTITIFVNTPFDICYARTKENQERPLVSGLSKEKLKQLYEKRYKTYMESAHIVVDGTMNIENQIKYLLSYFTV